MVRTMDQAMKRGRPTKSIIRQNIIDILQYMGKGYGYDVYKIYIQLFPKVTMRSVYYNLRKGIATGEIRIDAIEREKGEFSWGDEVEKTYYGLGKEATPHDNPRVKEFFNQRKIDLGNAKDAQEHK